MSFQLKILLLSFVLSVICALIIIPILKKLKVGQIERTEGPQSHLSKQGTPTMGGIIFIIPTIITTIFLIVTNKIEFSVNLLIVLFVFLSSLLFL